MMSSAASIQLIVNACSIKQGRFVVTRNGRATIRIDAARQPTEVFFRLTRSREFPRDGVRFPTLALREESDAQSLIPNPSDGIIP